MHSRAPVTRGLRTALTSAVLLGYVCTAPAVKTEEPGSITGHVRLTRVRGTPLPSSVYAPRAVDRHDPPPSTDVTSVVVYLKNVTYRATLPTSRQEIRQENETFVPRVVAVTKGSTVDFPNADPFFHNVFSLSSAATFDLGHYRQGEVRSIKFTKPGLVKVYCHIHSHMSASILVLDHPFFATASPDGTFSIPNVPPGSYSIVGWHERVGERTAKIDVESGRATSVELSLPIQDLP